MPEKDLEARRLIGKHKFLSTMPGGISGGKDSMVGRSFLSSKFGEFIHTYVVCVHVHKDGLNPSPLMYYLLSFIHLQ